jgi:uncharacterized iron-regulated membrane protein
MKINWRVWLRKIHRWGAVIIALPFLVVIVTGLLLQLKKQLPWVQPPAGRGQGNLPQVSFDAILDAAKSVPAAEIRGWDDIDRLDVRPTRGYVKVQARTRWEIQVDLKTAKILQVAYRRSDLIESIHDGSWFHDAVKLWVFLPSAVVVLVLWGTGIYLFVLPHYVRWTRTPPGKMPEKNQAKQPSFVQDRLDDLPKGVT